MSKNFEILMKANGTGDPLDAVSNGAEPNADYHADRASTSSQSSSGVDAPDARSVRSGSERNGSRSHGAHSPATALQRRSWGLMLAHMLGNRSLENASSLGVCPAGRGDPAEGIAAVLGQWMVRFVDTGVLLVEANLSRPGLAQALGAPSAPGLAELLLEPETSAFDAIHQSVLPGLWVLPAGKPVSRRKRKRIARNFPEIYWTLLRAFPNMIIDLPAPTHPESAYFPFGLPDAVLLTVRPNQTSAREIRRSKRRLTAEGANLVGSIISDPNQMQRAWQRFTRPSSPGEAYASAPAFVDALEDF